MARKTHDYKRLPGKRRGFLGVSSLWLGPDHILSIYGKGYSEAYKRFYYKDIQSLIIQQTESFKYTNIAAGLGFFLFGLLAWWDGAALGVVLALAAASFLIVLLINLWRGPTCRFFIRTAVQLERLPSVNRAKAAAKIMEIIRPEIQRAQGQLSPEILEDDLKATLHKKTAGPRPAVFRHESGRFHQLAFFFLLTDGLLAVLDIFINSATLTVAETLIALLTGFFVITALVKQHGSDIEGVLANLVWAALAYVMFSFASGYVISMIISMEKPETMNNYYRLVQEVSSLSALDHPWLLGLAVFSAAYSLSVSVSGLVLVAGFRGRIRRAEVQSGIEQARA